MTRARRGDFMDILMPQLGETVSEGKVTTWFKSVGDAVAPGDNLFEIETDKVSMEVPATAAGVLAEIRVGPGEVAPVGAVVAVIADKAGAALSKEAKEPSKQAAKSAPTGVPPTASPAPTRAPMAAAAPALAPPARLRGPVKLDPFFEVRTDEGNYGPARLPSGAVATPLARRLAAQSGIDIDPRDGLRSAWPRGGAATSPRALPRARRGRRQRRSPALAPSRSRRSIATRRSRKSRSTACARPLPPA